MVLLNVSIHWSALCIVVMLQNDTAAPVNHFGGHRWQFNHLVMLVILAFLDSLLVEGIVGDVQFL